MAISLSAAKVAPVSVNRLLPFMTGRMKERLTALPFVPSHAVIVLFEGRPVIGANGGDYSGNKAVLQQDCERLRAEHPDCHFHPSGNAWPLPAVQAARLAGLGMIGLNGLLFAPGLGFALTIGAVLTDMPLPDGVPLGENDGYCSLCGECVRQCPNGAITYQDGERGFERAKCLAHLRQKEGAPLERPGYYGCDLCQNICPMNS
ncbi:MAG: 4Fe-4S binding protein [Oscillospiraceae bacterium]|nr:4Fe-4S binding protein [Oscillospiraceae bacterium]